MGREEGPFEQQEARRFARDCGGSLLRPVLIPDQTVHGEERFWTIGRLENLVILVVVHTTRDEQGDEVMRIISARKATPRERRFYEEADK